ncbi:MAG: NACHT domain-containing protein, partial [Microcystaceae cyanobacterium]
QYIALQCNQGKYKKELIPLFVQLRNLTDEVREEENFSFLDYIIRQGERCGLSKEQVIMLLQDGNFLLLLDGLDEVFQDSQDKIFKEIDQFCQTFYKNQIIITCRSGAFNYYFRGFNYVEIADFNQTQIETFAKKWFVATANTRAEGLRKAAQFLKQLDNPENQPIRELGITPILLNLVCSVFKERSSFPTKRAKLYQVGLDILLKRWDQARGINRDRVYRYLSLTDKIKLLCQIASTTLERGGYFFESSEVLGIIEDYLRTLPADASRDLETLWLNSEAVLKAIELQHGLLVERAKDIYSFSHLTFQEYLTARKIVTSTNPKTLEQELQKLACRIFNSQWREVISLTASMLPEADFLVQKIKEQIDALSAKDPQLQRFLEMIAQKVSLMQLSFNASAIRA